MDDLLHKIDQVYQLLIEDTALIATTSRKGTITQFAEAMNACSQFIRTYSEITSICMVDRPFYVSFCSLAYSGRGLGKNVAFETSVTVTKCSEALDILMHQYRDRVAHDSEVSVHQTLVDLRSIQSVIGEKWRGFLVLKLKTSAGQEIP